MSRTDFQLTGKRVLRIEREGLASLEQYINDDFDKACELIFRCEGKVIIMGMGKSGHIGHKMAATFASTGTSSFFVHPGRSRTRRPGDGHKERCGYRNFKLR